jgi:GT2 family glycosyltransferase
MTSSVELSVIVPTKDRPHDLGLCLHALVGAACRSARAAEIVVVDDGSDRARTQAVVAAVTASAPPFVRLRYEHNPGPPGAAGARNHGAAVAQGPILGFIDDDAAVGPGWVDVVVATCRPGLALTGRIEGIGAGDPFSRARQYRYDQRRQRALADPRVDYLAGGNSAVARSDYERVGGFDTRFTMMHDRELALRLRGAGIEIRYANLMTIMHRHFKDLRSYVVMTWRSGRYRRLLERMYPQVGPWRPYDAVTSTRGVADIGVRAVIMASEFLHGLGYTQERYITRSPL